MALKSVNPATGETVKIYETASADKVSAAIEASHVAFRSWSRTPFQTRSSHLQEAAAILREHRDEFARLMALEMGKPVREGRAEAEKCAWVCEYYAEHGQRFLADETVEIGAARSYVAFRPLGPVLAVMPWNFPFWQVFRFAAPALMAGNTALLKHASNVPGCALAIEKVFEDAGFPHGVFKTLLIGSAEVAPVIADPRVAAVTLTGSTPAGKSVAALAGANLKKTVLELGGSDPYLILEDADIAKAAKLCAASRLLNGGQSCIAAKRFLVVDPVREVFEGELASEMAKSVMGDPMSEETTLGPQARSDLRDDLHRQVMQSVDAGAKLFMGGQVPDGPGAFYPASILTDVAPGMPAFDEELFGPVAAVVPVKDGTEAIELANRTVFGLGAGVFTKDLERGERIAREELDAGCCFVNDFVKSDPRLPFGGIKQSGYGRELARFGIREFVNAKSVVVR